MRVTAAEQSVSVVPQTLPILAKRAKPSRRNVMEFGERRRISPKGKRRIPTLPRTGRVEGQLQALSAGQTTEPQAGSVERQPQARMAEDISIGRQAR